MKNVFAKVSSKGGYLFVLEDKRISRANLAAAYTAEALAQLEANGVDTSKEDGEFIVEIELIPRIPVQSAKYTIGLEVKFTVRIDSVAVGLRVQKLASQLADFTIARIYIAEDYDNNFMPRWRDRQEIRFTCAGCFACVFEYGTLFDALLATVRDSISEQSASLNEAKAAEREARKACDEANAKWRESTGAVYAARRRRNEAVLAAAENMLK